MADDKTIDTLYLVGTGPIVGPGEEPGGWHLILEALRELDGIAGLQGGGDPTQVQSIEAGVSYLGAVIQWRRDNLVNRQIITEHVETFKQQEPLHAEIHATLKRAIARKLEAARLDGKLRLRDGFKRFVRNQAMTGTSGFITTNWDLLLEDLLKGGGHDPAKVQHIHGDVRDPDLMLLPGETIGENYRDPQHLKLMRDALYRQFAPFQAAKRLVVYGHSLSAIEAELRSALWAFFADAPLCPEICVVAKCKQEAEIIGQRLRPILPKKDWKIIPIEGEL